MGGIGAFFTGPMTSNVSWMLSGRRGIWDLMQKMRGEEYYPRTIDLHSKVIVEPSINHRFTFSGVYIQDEVTGVKEEEKDYIGTEKNLEITKDITTLGLNWRWLYSKQGFLLITPYVNLNDWGQKSGPDENTGKFGYETEENYYGIRAEFNYQLSQKHKFVVGGDFKLIEAQYNQWAGLDTLRTGVIVPPYKISFGPEETYKVSSFIQYSVTPYYWMDINLGIRTDYFTFTDDNVISPRLGASFDIYNNIRLNIASGLFYQFPQFYRIFLSPANIDLQASKSIHYIVGIEYQFKPDLQFKIEGFYKDMSNLPVAETDTSKVYESTGRGHAKGIEFTLTQKMSQDLYLLLNYTYSQSRREDITALEEYYSDYDSPHMLNIIATFRLGNWWEFALIYRYATGIPYTPYDLSTRYQVNGTWYCEEGPKNSERLPDYQRLDMRIDRRFIFNSWNFSIYFEIWNLTSNENITRYEYSADFSEKKPVTLFSITPMIGISVEF
jgi:outer membrane receptor for ferrienterochelin and colicin